jgi:hypothetical protein
MFKASGRSGRGKGSRTHGRTARKNQRTL